MVKPSKEKLGKKRKHEEANESSHGQPSTSKECTSVASETSKDASDRSGKRSKNTMTIERPPPNQTVKLGFKASSLMPPKSDDWAKKTISTFFNDCFHQEIFNFMIIRNMGTMLANYILFKAAIEPIHKRIQREKGTKMDTNVASTSEKITYKCPNLNQSFYQVCMSNFNSNARNVIVDGVPIQPKLIEYKDLLIQFYKQRCPDDMEVNVMFHTTNATIAKQLETNAKVFFNEKTKQLVKRLVIHFNGNDLKKRAGYLADILIREEFTTPKRPGQAQQHQNRQPHCFHKDYLRDAYDNTKKEVKYKQQDNEVQRWLFFHEKLLKLDNEYFKESMNEIKWGPTANACQRPHISLNQTEMQDFFRKKVQNILLFIGEQENPFCIFNYPKFKLPLTRHFVEIPMTEDRWKVLKYMHKHHLKDAPAKQLSKSQNRLWFDIKRVYDEFVNKSKVLQEELQTLDHEEILKGSNITSEEKAALDEKINKLHIDHNKYVWSYVLPSLKDHLAVNAYRRFLTFPLISTNGIDMSVYIFNPNKASNEQTPLAPQLTTKTIKEARIIGVDPGVTSLATSTYSHFLDQVPNGNGSFKYVKNDSKNDSTRITSREVKQKYYVECGPLARLSKTFNEKTRQRLMAIPYKQDLHSVPKSCTETLAIPSIAGSSKSAASSVLNVHAPEFIPSSTTTPVKVSTDSRINTSPAEFFKNYPNHKKDPTDIEHSLQLDKQHYIEASKIHFQHTSAKFKWMSYRFQQMKQSALAKRLVAPALCQTYQDYQQVRQEVKPPPKPPKNPKRKRWYIVKRKGLIKKVTKNQLKKVLKRITAKSAVKQQPNKVRPPVFDLATSPERPSSKVAKKARPTKSKSKGTKRLGTKKLPILPGQKCIKQFLQKPPPPPQPTDQKKKHRRRKKKLNSFSNPGNLRNQLRKPWLLDNHVYKQCKAKSPNHPPILVAFGDRSRNNTIVSGHYKSSADKLYSSLVQLMGKASIIDIDENLTSRLCHKCNIQFPKQQSVKTEIKDLKQKNVVGNHFRGKMEALAKQLHLTSIEEIPEWEVSKEDKKRLFLGGKRSANAILKCAQCNTVFNRDVNASINIMNKLVASASNNA